MTARRLLLGLAGLALAGCGTVHQTAVSSSSASYDEGGKNSGVLGFHVSAALLSKFASVPGTTFAILSDGTAVLDVPPGVKMPDSFSTDLGYHVTAHFRDRYNGLVAVYGKSKLSDGAPIFVPSLTKDDGLTVVDGNFLLDKRAAANMVRLSDLKAKGAPP